VQIGAFAQGWSADGTLAAAKNKPLVFRWFILAATRQSLAANRVDPTQNQPIRGGSLPFLPKGRAKPFLLGDLNQ
jgi:hypothetical protein